MKGFELGATITPAELVGLPAMITELIAAELGTSTLDELETIPACRELCTMDAELAPPPATSLPPDAICEKDLVPTHDFS